MLCHGHISRSNVEYAHATHSAAWDIMAAFITSEELRAWRSKGPWLLVAISSAAAWFFGLPALAHRYVHHLSAVVHARISHTSPSRPRIPSHEGVLSARIPRGCSSALGGNCSSSSSVSQPRTVIGAAPRHALVVAAVVALSVLSRSTRTVLAAAATAAAVGSTQQGTRHSWPDSIQGSATPGCSPVMARLLLRVSFIGHGTGPTALLQWQPGGRRP